MDSPMACDASRPAQNMRMLRHAVKVARPGTGEVARAIESCAFSITERGFTMLIGTCQRSGRCKKAMEIFDAMTGQEMAARGIRPNFYTYSSLISVCCSAGACSRALEVFHAMRKDLKLHGTCEADAEVYKRLITACHKDGRMVDVKALYDSLCENRLPAESDTMLCVMEGFAELKEWQQVNLIMDELQQRDAQIPARSFSRFLAACARHGDLPRTIEIFLSMQMMGVDPTPTDCHYVIRTAVAAHDVHTCMQMLEEMHNGGIEVSPATHACVSSLVDEEHTAQWDNALRQERIDRWWMSVPKHTQACRRAASWQMHYGQAERA